MLGTGMSFICVANGTKALLEDIQLSNRPDIHFIASQPCAGGVIEGLKKFRERRISVLEP
jgi:hypothetical protein